MARILTQDLGRYTFRDIAAGTPRAALEQFKLERLFELRAVIDALRSERDPVGLPDTRDPRSRQ